MVLGLRLLREAALASLQIVFGGCSIIGAIALKHRHGFATGELDLTFGIIRCQSSAVTAAAQASQRYGEELRTGTRRATMQATRPAYEADRNCGCQSLTTRARPHRYISGRHSVGQHYWHQGQSVAA
jgi:hypothetical protein